MSSDYLKVEFLDGVFEESDGYKNRITPFATLNGEIFFSRIKSAQKLTEDGDVKTVYNVAFDLKDVDREFLPGDTIGILPSNNTNLIDEILVRLSLDSVADKPCELKISKETLKKNPTIPKHLPVRSTLRNIFLNHVDVQTPPKKLFLKCLAKFVNDVQERAKLDQLYSPKASQEYTEFITTSGRTLLGLLNAFPSCKPPVETLLEHLPPLLPRPYSISSSPLSKNLEITFFVLMNENGQKGLCTGWLENLIVEENQASVPFYFRQPTQFRLKLEEKPLILIATGTGIAPFRGFLQHLKLMGCTNNQIWVFYGCRYNNKDFLFKREIEECLDLKILTRLDVSCSREGHKFYVQHNIEKNHKEFSDWVLKFDARIFLCGDFKTVVKDVKKSIVKILTSEDLDGGAFLTEMEKTGRFLVDSWS